MKHITEYRDAKLVQGVLAEIRRTVTQPWVLMEICGGQTHAIMRHGLDQLLPPEIELVHGPGCPVCVTSLELIDKALAIAAMPGVIFTSFGDMLRVPGSKGDLFAVRASGGDVRVVYSPLDALKIAQENPDKEVVFFAIGFETTAPANAMSVFQAKSLGVANFSILVSHVRVPAGNARHSKLTPQSRSGIPGCRACVCRDGILGISTTLLRNIRYSGRGDWLRAPGPGAGHLDGCPPARRRGSTSRECLLKGSYTGWQPTRTEDSRPGIH